MNLGGWDTGYAISINKVNEQLAKPSNSVVSKFDFSDKGPPACKASGTFGPWKLVEGGDGKHLLLKIPVTKGTFNIGGVPKNTDMSGVSFVFKITLKFLPSKTNPKQTDLTFNFIKAVAHAKTGKDGLVIPVEAIDPKNKLSSIAKAVLPFLMATYLVNKASSIAYVFASINLVKPGSGGWLAPVQVKYAYLELASKPPKGYLAILSVTDNRDISKYKTTVDPSIISGQNNAGFFVSKQLFLKNVIMPQLPSTFKHGTSSATFRCDPDDNIRNNAPFPLKNTVNGAVTYHPVCASLVMTTSANSITTHIVGACDLYMGINMTFTLDENNASSYNAATQKFQFSPDPNPRSKHSSSIPWYDWFMGPLPDIIVAAVVPYIAGDITSQLNAQMNKFTIASMSPQSVHWNGMKKIKVTNAGLNDVFFMVGQV